MSICFFTVPSAAHVAHRKTPDGPLCAVPKRKSNIYVQFPETRHTRRARRQASAANLRKEV